MRDDDLMKRIMKRGKRLVITILCCLPALILFGYFTRNIITSNIAQIAIYVTVMLVVVLIVETIAKRKEENKQEIEDVDVFK